MKGIKLFFIIFLISTTFLLTSCQVAETYQGGALYGGNSSSSQQEEGKTALEFEVFKFRDRSNSKGVFNKNFVNTFDELCLLKQTFDTQTEEYVFLNEIGESDLETKKIVVLHFYENSGSIQINVESVNKSENLIEVYVKKTVPLIGTCDMCGWNIFVVIDKEAPIESVETFVSTEFLSE